MSVIIANPEDQKKIETICLENKELRVMVDRAWDVDTRILPGFQHWLNRVCHCTMTLPDTTVVAEAELTHKIPCVIARKH